jgi:hypothetical protein
METQNNPVKLSQSESNGASQKGNIFLIIAIIIGIIAIGAVGFVLGKYFGGSELEKNGNEITKPLIEKETEKSEVVDETKSYLKILYPNGGEKLVMGETYDIKWEFKGPEKMKINVELLDYNHSAIKQFQITANPILASAEKYTWTITDMLGKKEVISGNQYKIKISESRTPNPPYLFDESDNYFSIEEKGKSENVSIFIDAGSFDLINKSFGGRTQSDFKNVEVLTTDSTKFYRGAYDKGKFIVDNYYTFSEFYSLLKNWSGPSAPFTIKGVFEKSGIIRADEVFLIVQ